MKSWIAVFVFCVFSLPAVAKPLVVLVPGFFNSLAPGNEYGPYFSRVIVETLEKRAEVLIVNNLAPFGDVTENSQLLLEFLNGVKKQYPDQSMTLITHSAGGIYALRALNLDPSLPIKTVVTLAAPYQGIDFIENLGGHVPGLEFLAHFLHLDALKEFRTAPALALMKSLYVPSQVRWIALSGMQLPCFLFTCTESKKLSWVLSLSQALMDGSSDGIVTVSSALSRDLHLLDEHGLLKQLEHWDDLSIPLEHWEMVEESSLFHLIGVVDTGHIDDVQIDVYTRILDRVL